DYSIRNELARKSNATYYYNFALAFEAALVNIRSKLPSETRPEAKLVNLTELAFADPKVSWVANDVTFKNGSFAPIEDAFLEAATDLACAKKTPSYPLGCKFQSPCQCRGSANSRDRVLKSDAFMLNSMLPK
nr:hypothetical protein [Tanacetum cinerariifolium]